MIRFVARRLGRRRVWFAYAGARWGVGFSRLAALYQLARGILWSR